MIDLIERLRDFPGNVLEGAPLCEAAADELERLRRELAEAMGLLREALASSQWDMPNELADRIDAFLTPSATP